MEQCIIGLKCNNFAMLAADLMVIKNICVITDDNEKIFKLGDRMAMVTVGEYSDTEQFKNFLSRHTQLYRIRNKYSLSIGAVAHFAGRTLADSVLRKPGFDFSNTLIFGALLAGYDDEEGGQLYMLQGLGTSVKVPFGSCGLAGMLSLGIMSQYYKPDLTETEAYELLRLCTEEIQQRYFVQMAKFQVVVINKDGIKQLPRLQQ